MGWLGRLFGLRQGYKYHAEAQATLERLQDIAALPIAYVQNREDAALLEAVAPLLSKDSVARAQQLWRHTLFVQWAGHLAAIAAFRKAYPRPDAWIRQYFQTYFRAMERLTQWTEAQRFEVLALCAYWGRDLETGVMNIRTIYEKMVFGELKLDGSVDGSIEWVTLGHLSLNHMLEWFITLSDKHISFIPRVIQIG